jgi:hypothetical protein
MSTEIILVQIGTFTSQIFREWPRTRPTRQANFCCDKRRQDARLKNALPIELPLAQSACTMQPRPNQLAEGMGLDALDSNAQNRIE